MKKIISKVLMILLAVMVIGQPLAPIDVSAATVKVTYNGTASYGGTTCGKFTVKGYRAFCAEHPKATPPTGTKIISTKK